MDAIDTDYIFDIPKNPKSNMIKVIGVGGSGGNAVNHMCNLNIAGVEFVLCNTDSQALQNSPVKTKIQLGASLTEGGGAGNNPEVGEKSAIESLPVIEKLLSDNTKMVFITAGMGGGTGTGAAPIIAKTAKDMGILTVAIVTIPFRNEGKRRTKQAIEGIDKLRKNVDSLLVISNEKIREIYGDFSLSTAFAKADDVLATAVKGIAEIITVHGYINVDFADVSTVMRSSDVALMGTGIADGPDRALVAIKAALESPLLNSNDISGARNILLQISSDENDELTMEEANAIIDYVQESSGNYADLIWGNGHDSTLCKQIKVTVIATGFSVSSIPELYASTSKDNVIFLDGTNSNEQPEMLDSLPKKSTFQTKIPFEVVEPIDVSNNRIIKADYRKIKEDLDDIPAYMRQNIDINGKAENDSSKLSRIALSDSDDDIIFSPDNSFLHDNVD